MTDQRKAAVQATDDGLVEAVRAAGRSLATQVEVGRPSEAPPAGVAVLVLEVDVAGGAAVEAVRVAARAAPDRKIVAAAQRADAEQVRALFRAGAADVVVAPFTAERLGAVLGDLLAGDPSAISAGKVVAVLKAGGGAGATLVAVNLAVLSQRARPTALLDLDLQFGDAAAALDLQPRSTLLDVLRGRDRFDDRFLDSVFTPHDSGLRVLAAPPSVTPMTALDPGFADDLLRRASAGGRTVVVDLPGAWCDWTLAVLRRADAVVLVGSPTVSSAFRLRRVLDGWQEAGLTPSLFLALNGCAGALDGLERVDRISKSLELPIDAALSFDPAAQRAADRGRAVVDAFPNARLTRDLRAAARKLGQRLGEAEAAAPSVPSGFRLPFARPVRSVGVPA